MKVSKVLIGILTYKRQERLKFLIGKIKSQKFDKIEPPKIEILISDNDINKSAYSTYNEMNDKRINYINVKEKGLSYGRNAVLNYAKKHSDILIFIDDDEYPSENWIEELLIIQKKYSSNIVTGPVIRILGRKSPDWIKRGDFYNSKVKYSNGESINSAFTGNVLINIRKIKNEMFDNRMNLTGGEDLLFFRNLYKKGNSIRWASNAKVYEIVSSERETFKWIIKHSFRLGNSYGLYLKYSKSHISERINYFLISIIKIFLGLITLPFAMLSGKTNVTKSLCLLMKGTGSLFGLGGIKYYEYK